MHKFLGWFVHNRVATNLLMWSLIFGGLMTFPRLHQEEFPNVEPALISISVPYPGASPEEIEQSICIRIEEKIQGSVGIEKITSVASEGLCSVNVEIEKSMDKNEVLGDLKSKVDSIDTFPVNAEKPIVSAVAILTNVIQFFVYGDTDERSLKTISENIRQDLVDLPEVSQVSVHYARPYEISIEISESTLRAYGTSLHAVTSTIAANSIDLPAGSINAADGEVLLRTVSQARDVEALADIVVITHEDGSRVRLGDIAQIRDGFVDNDVKAAFNGQRAMMINVKRIGEEDVIVVADSVKDYIANASNTLPNGIQLALWVDESQDLRDRLDVLGRNGIGGLVLIMLVLALFLKFELALWVAAGLPIALLGALIAFPAAGLTISTLSVVGFMLVLGLLVDDAVVVAERVHSKIELGVPGEIAAISGTAEVSRPVIFGVLTSMVAFTPLMMLDSDMAGLFSAIGVTAVIALCFSLIESQLILPMHLSHIKRDQGSPNNMWLTLQQKLTTLLHIYADTRYRKALRWCLHWRYLAISIAVAIVVIVMSILISGRMPYQYFPEVEGERLYANVSMPVGTATENTELATRQLLDSARLLQIELEESESAVSVTSSMVSIGIKLGTTSLGGTTSVGGHNAEVAIQLHVPKGHAGVTATELANRWRTLTGTIPNAEKLTFTAAAFSIGKAIDIQLRGRDLESLRKAAIDVRGHFASQSGVHDVIDSFEGGKRELQLNIKTQARNLGLDTRDLAEQVRQAFYGEEVQRIQRDREDIKVMVRYPEAEQKSLSNLESMRIRGPKGEEIPFSAVANAKLGRGFAEIKRIDGMRVISITADVDRSQVVPDAIIQAFMQDQRHALENKYGVEIQLSGEAEDSEAATQSLITFAAVAMFVIYALLAMPLNSYTQPLIVMSVIPFGATGAIIGHMIMGESLAFFSILGMMALAGVAVNSSLILVDFFNREHKKSLHAEKALIAAGVSRFRPIVLTSVTTFVGLVPLLVNQSISTSLFTPIAISLAFGVLVSAAMALLLVPCFCMVLVDAKLTLHRWRHGILSLAAPRGRDNSRDNKDK